ncbi:FAEL229Wp [Eremothecium gossypii FDAG1]|nr:FAEL229Wp [Eremothecium gossypii FDAG1]
MPSLIQSQESFDEELPNVLEKKATPKPQLQTEKLKHIELDSDNVDEELLSMINRQIGRSRKIMVLTGAGISCSAGIPDFRSSGGLYNMVKKQYPEVQIRSGQEMFDISLFREEEKISVFATFMDSLHSSAIQAKPTRAHEFIAHLKNRGKLLRCYTQNIDGLEEHLGLEMSHSVDPGASFNTQWKNLDVVQLHGDLNSLSCTQCFEVFNWTRSWKRILKAGELPPCPRCCAFNQERENQGKRLRNSVGILRPNIVLYGENHPSCEFITQGLNMDIAKGKPDLLIIMGTSLKVDGVKKLVKSISRQVHERSGIVLLINSTTIGDCNWHGIIDYQILAECDAWVADLKKRLPDFFMTQQQVDKLRQLKREASELKKRQRKEQYLFPPEERRNIPNTPPSTPSPTKRRRAAANTPSSTLRTLKETVVTLPPTQVPSLQRDQRDTTMNKIYMKLIKDDDHYAKLTDMPEEELMQSVIAEKKAIAPSKNRKVKDSQSMDFDEVPTDVDEP